VLLPLLISTESLVSSATANAEIRSLMQKHDPILLWAGRLMPPSQADAAYALYGWCRRLDQIVDEPSSPMKRRVEELDEWEQRMDELWAGSPRDEMDAALLRTLRANPSLGREPFDEMCAGMRSDLTDVRYERFRPDLLRYCYRVAGTVGEMLLPVLGLNEEEARHAKEPAIAFGMAVQLINIVRDVRPDVALGRIYLPREDMDRFGVSEADVLSMRYTPAYRKLVRLQARRGEALLRRAESSLPGLPSGARLIVATLIALYRELLVELRTRDYNNLEGERVRVPTWRKLLLTCSTALRLLLA